MTPTSGRDEHLSIGEVLSELGDEFPDITISKIRFLESQGLVNPERTPSGYRKFSAGDLARLRWILFQQKEHFLPLKVIKERLDQLPPGGEARLFDAEVPAEVPAEGTAEVEAVAPVGAEAASAQAAPRSVAHSGPRTSGRRGSTRRVPAFAPTLPADNDDPLDGPADSGDARHTSAELAAAAGLTEDQVVQMESFGLIAPVREIGGVAEYDDDALDVARIAGGFFARGIEARHLRMYRTFAEREAVLFGQVLLPYVRQRNPEARARLQEELGELASLGRRLRTALLGDAVRDTLAE